VYGFFDHVAADDFGSEFAFGDNFLNLPPKPEFQSTLDAMNDSFASKDLP
jgi:hypothetical protein